MANIRISHRPNGDTVFTYTKGAVEETDVFNKPTGEKIRLVDRFILHGNELYVVKNRSEEYVTNFAVKPSVSVVCELIQSGSIRRGMENHHHVQKELKQLKWSIEFNGKSILALIAVRPKMSYAEILNVITNEGGTVDNSGIIHKPE